MIPLQTKDILAERARRDYLTYVRHIFPEFQGGDEYEVNWHHRHFAQKLQEFADPKSGLKFLMVFVPPQHGKSLLCSRFLPGWILGHNPRSRIIACSYNADLALSMSRDAKRAINLQSYREIFPGTALNEKHVVADARHGAKNTAAHWETVEHLGAYMARGAGQGVDGNPADYIIMDDVLSQQMVKSEKDRQAVYDWWVGSLRARLSRVGKVLLVMTRWHLDDIAGRLLTEARTIEGAFQWEVIRYPAIKETDDDPTDPREIGEALWPEFKNLDDLRAIKGPNPGVFDALYQQNPVPPGGTIIKTDDIQYWTALPSLKGRWIQSWDLRAGGKKLASSYAVGQLWFVPDCEPANAYLVDQRRDRWDFNETVEQFISASEDPLWKRGTSKLVEEQADGRALIPSLRGRVSGIEPVKPVGTKDARLEAVAPFFRGMNVFVPDPSLASWAPEYVHELTSFPGSSNDDQVDATTQALDYLFLDHDADDDDGRWAVWSA